MAKFNLFCIFCLPQLGNGALIGSPCQSLSDGCTFRKHNPHFHWIEFIVTNALALFPQALTRNSTSHKKGCPCISCQRHFCPDELDVWAAVHKLSCRISLQKHLYILMLSEFTACQGNPGTATLCQS